MVCLSLLFCSVFMGICVWGAQLYCLQADTYGLSGAIQETIERHEDSQEWREVGLENVPQGHGKWQVDFNCTYILIVSLSSSEYHLVI